MHSNDVKRGVRLALASLILLSGVVIGAATINTKTVEKISLSELKFSNLKLEPAHWGIRSENKKSAATEKSTSRVSIALPEDVPAEVKLSSAYYQVEKAVKAELRRGRPTAALALMSRDTLAQNLKNSEFDRIKAQIAHSYLLEGKVVRAAEVAEEVVQRSGKLVPLSGWVAGQAAWRQDDFGRAADMFAMTARSPQSSEWLVSGAAYWAARASLKAGRFDDVANWQEKAASYPRTFYGLVALKALGRDYDFNRDLPVLAFQQKRKMDQSEDLSSAIRMVHQGEVSSAINKLARSGWLSSRDKREQLLAYVQDKNVPALVLYLGRNTKTSDGRFFDLALYPESPWEPASGYQVDKAIVHALIRQESRFNPHATSHVGASGLMQLMPETAKFVAKRDDVVLEDPKTNLEIGQKYVGQLLRDPVVNNDLLKMAVAYNAGPGNLSKWKRNLSHIEDPLLFIETIPSGETRAFVERVMVNYWMYRMRMGQDVDSLDAIAALDRPDYLRVAQRIGSNFFAFNQ